MSILTTWDDRNVAPGLTYYYVVDALALCGNCAESPFPFLESSNSNEASASVPDDAARPALVIK
jgi:hypothetical protein